MQNYKNPKRIEDKTATEEFAEKLAELLVMQVELIKEEKSVNDKK